MEWLRCNFQRFNQEQDMCALSCSVLFIVYTIFHVIIFLLSIVSINMFYLKKKKVKRNYLEYIT